MEANETISPSAYALLMMKSHTSIPFIREAAALVAAQSNAASAGASGSPAPPDHSHPADIGAGPAAALSAGQDIDPVDYWMRVMHFESRYWSINQLLEDLPATNILELSSGFSFRGLDLSYKKPVYYIDTDLPNIISGKQKLIDALIAPGSPSSAQSAGTSPSPGPGHYELQALNALDPVAFDAVIGKFPPGPLSIVNEGLLVYLDPTQKAQLCCSIRKALLTRGGRWITADIYIKRGESGDFKSDAWRQWSREHGLEEKKFASFHEAQTFFQEMGFEIEKEATQDFSRLTSFPQFLKVLGPQGLAELRRSDRPRLQATWRLKPKA